MAGWTKTAKKVYKKGKKAYKFGKAHQTEARRALVLAKKVARMVNVEYKYDYTNLSTTIPWTGTVWTLLNPTQGDSVTSRDADSIKPMRCSGRIVLSINPSAINTQVRLILFRGHNENGSTYAATDILYNASGLMTYNPKLEDNKFQTKFLYDKLYVLTQANKTAIVLDWNFKLYGHTKFTAGSTNIENGGVYLLATSNEPVNTPAIATTLKVSFTDN